MARPRRGGAIEPWPGYVDALSTLLMVTIFVLLVFVLAQGFLSVALSTRDRALDRLNRQVAELAELLALERGQAEELRSSLARAGEELAAAAAARDAAMRSLAQAREERERLTTERDAARTERERLAARIVDLGLADRAAAERVATLERQLGEALARAERVGGDGEPDRSAETARSICHATVSSSPSNRRRPSSLPCAASITRSGCGIMPSTLPPSLRMPAMLRADPFTVQA